jgi:HAD superfamily hydrolase (TIGR01509 family)
MARAGEVTGAPGPRVRAVLFDIGDTLVRRPAIGPGRRIADALGLSPDAARTITRLVFRERIESPRALAERLRDALGLADDIEAAVATIWRAQEREPIEVPGATACVAAARAAGARIAIVSNIWHPYACGFRAACPAIVPLVDSWHLSYQAGVAKPDPALFTAALAAVGARPDDAVMVGDSPDKDIVPAAGLGLRTVWVPADSDARSASAPAGCAVARDLEHARALVLAALAA